MKASSGALEPGALSVSQDSTEALIALRDRCVLRRGQDVPSFPRAPYLAPAPLPPLRSGQVFLDEAEHFLHNRSASVATLRKLFAFGPECRSRSLRNQRSPSPESPPLAAGPLVVWRRHHGRVLRIPAPRTVRRAPVARDLDLRGPHLRSTLTAELFHRAHHLDLHSGTRQFTQSRIERYERGFVQAGQV